jgi:hypothetical protein
LHEEITLDIEEGEHKRAIDLARLPFENGARMRQESEWRIFTERLPVVHAMLLHST